MNKGVSRRSRRRSTWALALASGLVATSLVAGPTTAFAGDVTRIGGEDRIATAIAVFEKNPNVFTSDTVIITRSDEYADALTATPLAAALKAPVLTTGPDGLDPRVLESLKKSGKIKNVIVIGGEKAVGAAVTKTLADAGLTTERIAGTTRYDTAVKIAEKVMAVKGTDSVPVFLATGTNFPDALAAGAAAAAKGAVVLLSQGSEISPETAAFIKSDKASSTLAVGGPAGKAMYSAGVAGRVVIGTDRYDTAAKLAAQVHPKPTSVVMASGETYADSLAGAALAAITGAPLVLTGSTEVPAATKSYIDATNPEVSVLGGEKAIPADVAQDVATTVGGEVRDAPNPAPTTSPSPTASPIPTPTRTPSTTNPPASTNPPATTQPPVPPVATTPPPSISTPVDPSPDDTSTPTPPAALAWVKDLPETTAVWEGDDVHVHAEANWYRDVQFVAWVKRPGDTEFRAQDSWGYASWGAGSVRDGTEHGIDGAQVYFTGVWEGQDDPLRSKTTTIKVLTPNEAPDAAVPTIALTEEADVVSDMAYPQHTFEAVVTGATKDDGVVEFSVRNDEFSGYGTAVGRDDDGDGRFTAEWQSPVPGDYTVDVAFRPKDPYAHRFVKSGATSFTVTEDPAGRLQDTAVTVQTPGQGINTKPLALKANVATGGVPVTTGHVEFWSGYHHLCTDVDGSDNEWSCAWTAQTWLNDKPLRAKYIAPPAEMTDAGWQARPARVSGETKLSVRDFSLGLWDGATSSMASDPVELGVDTAALTRNGEPLTVKAGDGVELGIVEEQGIWRSYGEEGDVAPVVAIDGDDHRVTVSTSAATTPGVWVASFDARTENGHGQSMYLTVTVLPEDGTVVDTQQYRPGMSWREDADGNVIERRLNLPGVPGATWTVDGADSTADELFRPDWWGWAVPWPESPVVARVTPLRETYTFNGPLAWKVGGDAQDSSLVRVISPEVLATTAGGPQIRLRRYEGVSWKVDGTTYGPDAFGDAHELQVPMPDDGLVEAVDTSDTTDISGPFLWHLVPPVAG